MVGNDDHNVRTADFRDSASTSDRIGKVGVIRDRVRLQDMQLGLIFLKFLLEYSCFTMLC